MPPSVNITQIRRAVQNNIPLTIKTYMLTHETEEYIDKVVEQFLKEIGYIDLVNPVTYCVKELAVNAKKANTKRIYFREKNLNIDNKADYETGMKTFKTDTLSNINYYLEKQKEAGLYVKLILRTKLNTLTITVYNNVEITKKEQMRIFDRIARSRAFESMEEAFATVLDDSEGAGLGIVILILMLKKMGLNEDAFEIDVIDGETLARIVIPFSDVQVEKMDMLAKAIVKEINSLPQFPENLLHLQKLIADPESDIQDIARQVSTDPTLIADLLKQVNSALYMLPRKIDNIVEAVTMVGMRGLRNLLYKHGSQKILKQKYSEMRQLWQHSYRVAFYSFSLAKTFRKKKDVWDDAYVGGILHDLGKIIVNSLHPDLLEKIKKFCIEKNIPEGLIENFSVGLNHAEVGAMIASKWNFPDQLVAAIRYHHIPLEAVPEYEDVINSIYLANVLANYENNKISYEQIEPKILKYFNIADEEQLNKILKRLQDYFSKDAEAYLS